MQLDNPEFTPLIQNTFDKVINLIAEEWQPHDTNDNTNVMVEFISNVISSVLLHHVTLVANHAQHQDGSAVTPMELLDIFHVKAKQLASQHITQETNH